MTATPGQAARYRMLPVDVEAVQWTGDNIDEIYELTGCENFDVLNEQDRANCDDPEATATVFGKLHSTWTLVYDGQWIIKGIRGEFFRLPDDLFREAYEPAAQEPHAVPDPAGAMFGPLPGRWSEPQPAPELAAVLPPDPSADELRLAADRDDYAARLRTTARSWAKVAAERDALRDGITELLAGITRSANATRPSKKTALEDEFAIALRKLLEDK